MPESLRVASFNVENLFGRAKVFNFKDQSIGDKILEKIDELRGLLQKASYSESDKKRILDLYQELKPYIEIREDREKLFKRSGRKVTGVKADGAGDWDGTIEFKRAKFSQLARENTAKVIKDVKADIACIIEAENRQSLKEFDSHLLRSKYRYEMLIDGNNNRGIDVGLYSNYPIGGVWTHIFDKVGRKTVFSRDCLEVEMTLPGVQPLYFLCNHFKSRGYDYDGSADSKRKMQAVQAAKILEKYDLEKDFVIIAGDLNDNPTSAPLKPLLKVKDLYDVLALQYPDDPNKRWTYHYKKFEQIDFILVSKPLKTRFLEAGVNRRGIYQLEKLTSSANGLVDVEKEYDDVKAWSNAASDHGAVWANFKL
jgi:endonuclease/exonuclease/phosphatase family metal-dependent hydrolase